MTEGLFGRRSAVLALLLLTLMAAFVRPGEAADWEHIQPPDPNVLFNDPAFLRSLAETSSETQAAKAAQQTPQAEAARDASASAYTDLSASGAQDLAQRTFPELMSRQLDPLELPDGVFVKDYLSPTVASLVNSEGKGSLLVGTQPLATRDAGGRLQAIDLTLETTGDAYVPTDPAADVAFPLRADDFVTFDRSDVGVKAADAPDVAGLREDDRVFYPEVATDTDFAAMPTPTGAEVMWQLRSDQAAESLPLELDLPAGATVRLASALTAPLGQAVSDAGAGAEVVGKDGTVLDTISPPVAYDADGTSIDAAYRIDGDQLIVDVPHRSADIKYPVAVDPEVHQVYGQIDLSSCGYDHNWAFGVSGNLFQKYCNNSGYGGYGLYVQSDNGGFYSQGSSGYWWTGTPSYVHIISAWLDGMYHTAAGSHFFAGMADQYGWEPGSLFNWGGDMMNGQATLVPSSTFAPNDMNSVEFGLWMDWTGQRPYGLAGIHGANIRLGDYYAPSAVNRYSINIPINKDGWAPGVDSTNWLKGDEAVSGVITASDAGLGINNIGVISGDSTWYAGHRLIACTGDRSGPCPASTSYSGGLNFAHFKGVTSYYPFATDITGNSTRGRPFVAKVDPDNPQLTYSGDVINHQNDGYLPQNPGVHISAYDGSNTTPSLWQSGVKSVRLYIDENDPARRQEIPWQATETACDNCSRQLDFTIPNLGAGTHTLRASVTDYAGRVGGPVNGTPQTISFYYAPTSAQYGGTDHSVNTADEAATVGALLAGAGYQAIWNGLATGDKNYMLTIADDPYFSTWAPRIDLVAPAAPDGIQISDEDNSARTADIVWSEGDDPDVSGGVFGSAVDEARSDYRYQRAGGSWTSWMSSDSDGFTLTSADAGDTVAVEARNYDRAGNVSASATRTLHVPDDTPVAHDSFFALPVVACIEWCPVVAAGIYAGRKYYWSVNHDHYDWSLKGSGSDISVTPATDHSPTFEDAEAQAKTSSKRKAFRRRGEAVAADDNVSIAGKEAHHVVAAGAKAARYARWVFFKCGVDPNDFDANGVWLDKRYHRRMHTKDYYEAINDMLRRYDPTFGDDPCGHSQSGADVDGRGLKRAMQAIIDYVKRGEMP